MPDPHHLAQLLVADEGLVDLENGLLEDEVDWIFEDFLGVRADHVLPYLLIEGELHFFARVLIEALEVATIYVDSLAIDAAKTEICLDLTSYVLSFHYPFCLALPFLQI